MMKVDTPLIYFVLECSENLSLDQTMVENNKILTYFFIGNVDHGVWSYTPQHFVFKNPNIYLHFNKVIPI